MLKIKKASERITINTSEDGKNIVVKREGLNAVKYTDIVTEL